MQLDYLYGRYTLIDIRHRFRVVTQQQDTALTSQPTPALDPLVSFETLVSRSQLKLTLSQDQN